MSSAPVSFRAALVSLWFRFVTLTTVVLLFILASWLPGRLARWLLFLTPGEVIFEAAVRVIFVALTAMALATLLTALAVPFLLRRTSSRTTFVEACTKTGVALTVCAVLAIVLTAIADSAVDLGHLSWFPIRIVLAAYLLAFAAALCLPRSRDQVVAGLDGILSKKATRRTVIATGVSSAALVAGEFVAGKATGGSAIPRKIPVSNTPGRTGPNVLLITFDALSAEHMSLYGYGLPTTPCIDEFARGSSVFTNFYSASTFTTPGISSILTGLYPSEHHVYHVDGSLRRGGYARKTLQHLMRAEGYSTAASLNNPVAWFLADGISEEFDYLPEMPHRPDFLMKLWNATSPLHQHQPFGTRNAEFGSLEWLWSRRATLKKYFPAIDPKYVFTPSASFEQARETLDKLPDGFFLWVHTLAPHAPRLPDAPYLGRFSHPAANRGPMDGNRFRYDELLAEADGAFGAFLSSPEVAARLKNTAVIVAADHGESFEGGVLGHGGGDQTRPVVHVPLIVHMPGQEHGYRVSVTADHTALAPTILDIAGLPRPSWMRGGSLVPWLTRDGEGGSEGLAFTQFLETDSIVEPLRSGTVGVVDGNHQCVLDIATGKAKLRRLAQAHLRDLDCSDENPALAQRLREVIYARFPDLPRLKA